MIKIFYKKDYQNALFTIFNLKQKNVKLVLENSNLNEEMAKLSENNDNLIIQNKLLVTDNDTLKNELKTLKLEKELLEDKLSHSYTLKRPGSGRPVKPQTMKIKSSVASRSPVRNYMKEEFNYEES